MEGGFPGAQSDWAAILQLLNGGDEMLVYQGCMELRDALSYAQENQMQGFQTDSYMDILVKIVQKEPETDLSNEVKFFAIQSLTTLMDIFPNLVNGLVSAGLVKHMTNVLQSSFGFIDLSEACIKAFEKIVIENPPAVLRSGAVNIILQQMDFFEVSTQQRIFKIIQRIARHSSSEADFDQFVQPLMPFVCMSLGDTSDQKKLEDLSRIVFEMQESFYMFYNPVHDGDKVSQQYDKLINHGIYDIVLNHLHNYADVNLKILRQKALEEAVDASEQIDSAGSTTQAMSQQTVLNFFSILENSCRYSVAVSNKLFADANLLKDLRSFLPSNLAGKRKQYNSDDYPLINEATSLLNAIFSDKDKTEEFKDPESMLAKRAVQKAKLDKAKREFQTAQENRVKVAEVAENLLPRVFFVFESTINPLQRIRTLQLIDKMIALFDGELLTNFINPQQFAGFIVHIIRSKNTSSIEASLKITKKVLDCGSQIFVVPFIREGLSKAIKDLSTEAGFKAFMGISSSININDKNFDLDIHEVKETLHHIRVHNPDDHSARDFYERRLLDLVDRQKQMSKPEDANQAKDNLAQKIIDQSKTLVDQYFDNQQFLDELKASSDQVREQLQLEEQLTKMAQAVLLEATVVHQNFHKMGALREVLDQIANLLTSKQYTLTSFEFINSRLLQAFELLLTKSPSQAKLSIDRARREETGEEMKHSEELELAEAKRLSQQVSKKESRCLINRFKLFSHVMLARRGNRQPMQVLIEISQKIVSENDQFLLSQKMEQQNHGLHGSLGDYDHCINALRQLQRRVTINLIYDKQKSKPLTSKLDSVPEDKSLQPSEEDSIMESHEEFDTVVGEDPKIEAPQPVKKGQSHHPALMNLAGSPSKQNPVDRSKLNSSKVFMKRHQLYSELKQIPVTVEQSSCVQILEDFLRNRIKTMDHVRSLKFDYGISSFGQGGPPGGSQLFGGFGQQYQSITQKILRKSLGNGARKLLDSLNDRLAKIINSNVSAFKIRGPPKAGRRAKRIKDDEEMDSHNDESEEEEQEDDDDSNYEDVDEEAEAEQEMDLQKQQKLDEFVEQVPDEVINSGIPDSQQHLLIKILTLQHTFMIDKLKQSMEEGEFEGEEDYACIEEKLDDFQDTMERIQTRFFDKKGGKKVQKKEESEGNDSDFEMVDESNPGTAQPKIKEEPEEQEEAIDEQPSGSNKPKDAGIQHDKPEKASSAEKPNHPVLQDDDELWKSKSPNFEQEMEKELAQDVLKIQRTHQQVEQQVNEERERFKQMFEKELAEQDQKIKEAMDKERAFHQKIKEGNIHVNRKLDEGGVSEQTQENMDQDLEELIRQQGEDIDFQFFYEGKPILPSQSIFEAIKDSSKKKEQSLIHQDQLKKISQKIEENRNQARQIQDGPQAERDILKREADRLKEIMAHIQNLQSHTEGLFGGGLNAHNVYFVIKDKADDMTGLKRQRLDSLAELTTFSRQRTKSEIVKDISSSTINEIVQTIIEEDFKVFEPEKPAENTPVQQPESLPEDIQAIRLQREEDLKKKQAQKKKEKTQVEKALKLLKVINFLFSNQDLISEKGIQLIMKANLDGDDEDESPNVSPVKQEQEEAEYSDVSLKLGFQDLASSLFQHHKLDSYLQKSIMDPYNLVQGGISTDLTDIFKNCAFLFPFTTKQLYFKLVSFISAIDAHRAIYFLRQYIKQQGASSLNSHEKDNLKKIAKQKAVVRRDKLIPSALSLLQKIDKRSFLEFEFQGEEGVGLGPTLEFYDNIAEEFKAWKVKVNDSVTYDMWRLTADNLLFPSPVCIKTFSPDVIKQIYEIFRLCGTLVAKAIVDDRQIDLPISPLFWRLCLGNQMSIFDMKKLDADIFGTLAEFQIISGRACQIEKKSAIKKLDPELRARQLASLTLTNGSQVEDYALDFTLPCFSHIELIPEGKDRDVKLENAQDYVDLVLHYTFHDTVKIQMQAFKKGFNAIFPISSLAPFTKSSEEEIETMVCGIGCNDTEWQDKDELTKNIEPDHGLTRKSEQYQHFIRYIMEQEGHQRKEFIKFLTGSKRLPIGGFKALQPHLTIVLKRVAGSADSVLPSVMSCQNYVKCPQYSSYAVFKQRFDLAVKEGQQNFTLS